MPRRAALVTQADVARALRACRQAGLAVTRIIVRADGAAIETMAAPPAPAEERPEVEPGTEVVL